ncbi:Probable inactive receptor kinase [Striga hermonthica]|uniref:Probable inactive receptor kinase n=1 Tax=Striga hermonthica TaxID=68872 RepID=A0A9N7NHI0_STRHE|nr:Probable inactive receptor kinase [Striga hermonthica]
MSAIYDNWERLVDAVLKKQQLWQLFHDHSRSPSVLSEASNFSSSFNSRASLDDLALDLARLGSLSTYQRTTKLIFVSYFSHSINFEHVQLASSEFLGRGTFGSVYVATMDNGVGIVVKRLDPTSVSQKEFNRQMAIVGGVRHVNVVSLRAYYSSEDERLILYDYYRLGSVYSLLHGRNGKPRANVDWESRLKIAIGAARGIAEIHKHNGGELVHGNIKSSNVFRNPDQYGCISDLGPTSLIQTAFEPTAYYYAPEVKSSQNVSQASDVYSFGIMLLELLTRKPSVHFPGGPKAVDLVKMVTSIRNKIRAANVFDADLLKQPTIKDQMVKTLQIGMKCVEKSMKKRPRMSEVVKMLEEISSLYPISGSPVARKLVFIEDPKPTFDLEDLLRSSAEVLGEGTFGSSYLEGTFGSSYLARLEPGHTIVVKRMKGVVLSFNNFQQHMDMIGRMVHKNVAEVRAYYYSKDETLLVYDHYVQDSVSVALHGKLGTDETPLDWETRLKIAVDAARGIAHIHSKDGRKLVHGNIKSSNIFLNGQKHGIISDVGLAKLVSPVRRSVMPNPGYYAPELRDTGNVCQSSDVYSFGVLLLELLTGKKTSQISVDESKTFSLVDWVISIAREEWIAELFDLELLRYDNVEKSIVQTLQIAMECASSVPERRPRMSEVVKMLEEISGIEPLYESGSEDSWEQPTIDSRLEDLLEDLLPTFT